MWRVSNISVISSDVQSNTTFIYLKYLLTLGYMFRFTRNHNQALSKNTQIHYIKLFKRVLISQTFTINFWLWYIYLCYSYSIWIFCLYTFLNSKTLKLCVHVLLCYVKMFTYNKY